MVIIELFPQKFCAKKENPTIECRKDDKDVSSERVVEKGCLCICVMKKKKKKCICSNRKSSIECMYVKYNIVYVCTHGMLTTFFFTTFYYYIVHEYHFYSFFLNPIFNMIIILLLF